ncbi:MAG: hypothetical protein M3R25_10280 [Bacteroidota bacterium]|nr:hypothetical protein [Bacteroidota bacterium]
MLNKGKIANSKWKLSQQERFLAGFKQTGYALSVIVILTIYGCEPDAAISYVVETPLQDYFERFIDEAAVRGREVEDETYQVSARIDEIKEPNVIGQCSWNQNNAHNIVVDEDYWKTASDLQREFLVFHELGHCVLGKEHNDGADGRGNCESIMSSGTGNCRVVYSKTNRDVLLDELFLD